MMFILIMLIKISGFPEITSFSVGGFKTEQDCNYSASIAEKKFTHEGVFGRPENLIEYICVKDSK